MELNFDKLFTRKENINYDRTKMVLTYLNIDQHHDSPISTCRLFANNDKDMYIYNGIFEFFSIDPLQEKDYTKLVPDSDYYDFQLSIAYAKAMLLDNKNLYINSIAGKHENRFLVYTILWKLLSYDTLIIHHTCMENAKHLKHHVLDAYNKLPESIKDQIPSIESRIIIVSKGDLTKIARGRSSSTFLMMVDTELCDSDNMLKLSDTIKYAANAVKFKFNWMIYSIIPRNEYEINPNIKELKDSILPLQLYMLNHQDILDSQDSFYLRFDYNELGMTTDDINEKKIMYNNKQDTICQELYMLDYDKYTR